jgi:hypothetical protein
MNESSPLNFDTVSMNVRRKIIIEHPAYKHLVEAADVIRKARDLKDVPASAVILLDNANSLVSSSIQVLLEKDPLKHKLGMICLMLIESTTYSMQKVDGKMKEVIDLIDEQMFAWAIRELHLLPAKFK